MFVVAIFIADLSDPIEMQAWLNNNPSAVIDYIVFGAGIFYVFYH